MNTARVQTGLAHFMAAPPAKLLDLRWGLLCNQASVDSHLRHARDLFAERFPGRLQALFSPQHGYYGEKQDNMIESDHLHDPQLGIPIFSLYGETRIPTAEMLASIDVLIVDLQDVGTRVYTFAHTVSLCLEAAARCGKSVVILDRPNPIGGLRLEGNLLIRSCRSFVGRYELPMRHGLTMGELALLYNRHWHIDCDLTVIPMHGWQRKMYFCDTGLPWVPPSPNLPTPDSAVVYPGQVIWEGTQVSEGRGTCQPFELFGAPYLDPQQVAAAVAADCCSGVYLRPLAFEPTSGKHQGQICRGFQVHVIDRDHYCPYQNSLALLAAVLGCHRDHFAYKQPPYEYEYERLPFDLITGDPSIRRQIEAGTNVSDLAASWQTDLSDFAALSRDVYLYQ